MKYKICPKCAAHLDHGERCECKTNAETAAVKPQAHIRPDPPEEECVPPPFSLEEWNAYCDGTLEPPKIRCEARKSDDNKTA